MTRHPTNDDQSIPKYLSSCHNAPVYVVSGGGGTSHYNCNVCNTICAFYRADQSNADSNLIPTNSGELKTSSKTAQVVDNTGSNAKAGSEEELRETILAYLKKAYFNARTDVVGEQNGFLKDSSHALSVLENMTNDLLQEISTAFAQSSAQAEMRGRIDELNKVLQMPVTTVEYEDIGTQACVRTALIVKRLARLRAQGGENK